MPHHVHHVHLFASNLEKSLLFYKAFFGGEIILDMEIAGARNIFMKVGTGRIHFYDQPPKCPAPAASTISASRRMMWEETISA